MNKDNGEDYTFDTILRNKFGERSKNPSQMGISPDSLSRDAKIALDRLELNRLVRDRAYAKQQG